MIRRLSGATAAYGIVTTAVFVSAVVAAAIDDRMLTPVFFYGDSEIIPHIRWTVVGAQVVVLIALLLPALRRWGVQLAWAVAVTNLIALALNGLASAMLFSYDGSHDGQALKLIAFLAAQIVALLGCAVCIIEEIRDRSVNRAAVVFRALTAVGFAIALAAFQWKLAAPTRFVSDSIQKSVAQRLS